MEKELEKLLGTEWVRALALKWVREWGKAKVLGKLFV
jgi:hypothetical protein